MLLRALKNQNHNNIHNYNKLYVPSTSRTDCWKLNKGAGQRDESYCV